jgi:hypothetical protein
MAQSRVDPRTSAGRAQASAHSLDRWCAHEWRNGIQIPALEPLDRLLVRTCNHVYEVIVLDPCAAEVMVRGGHYFPEFTRARVTGSSLGGGFLKLHGIYTGFRLELHSEAQAIVTSPVRTISRGTDRAAA